MNEPKALKSIFEMLTSRRAVLLAHADQLKDKYEDDYQDTLQLIREVNSLMTQALAISESCACDGS